MDGEFFIKVLWLVLGLPTVAVVLLLLIHYMYKLSYKIAGKKETGGEDVYEREEP